MTFTLIDRVISREVALTRRNIPTDTLPKPWPDDYDARFEASCIAAPAELRAIIESDPLVDYPVVYPEYDVAAGTAPAPYLYPPKYGAMLRLSGYLDVLRRFLIPQFVRAESYPRN